MVSQMDIEGVADIIRKRARSESDGMTVVAHTVNRAIGVEWETVYGLDVNIGTIKITGWAGTLAMTGTILRLQPHLRPKHSLKMTMEKRTYPAPQSHYRCPHCRKVSTFHLLTIQENYPNWYAGTEAECIVKREMQNVEIATVHGWSSGVLDGVRYVDMGVEEYPSTGMVPEFQEHRPIDEDGK